MFVNTTTHSACPASQLSDIVTHIVVVVFIIAVTVDAAFVVVVFIAITAAVAVVVVLVVVAVVGSVVIPEVYLKALLSQALRMQRPALTKIVEMVFLCAFLYLFYSACRYSLNLISKITGEEKIKKDTKILWKL